MMDPQPPGPPNADPYEQIGRYPRTPQKPPRQPGPAPVLLFAMLGGFLALTVVATAVLVVVVNRRPEPPPSELSEASEPDRGPGSGAPATPLSDRDYLVTIDDLLPYREDLKKVASAEKVEKDSFLGSEELSYEYEPPGDDSIYVSSSVTVDRNASGAGDTYSGLKLGLKIGLAAGEVEVEQVERDDLLKWGDESKTVLLTTGGQPFGNAFIGRKGRRTYFVTIAGVYFDEPATFRELMEPKLKAAERYDP